MSLLNVLSVRTRPEKAQEYESLVADIARQAQQSGEAFPWTTHQIVMGGLDVFHFASPAQDFAEIAARGQTPEMLTRVLGEARARKTLQSLADGTQERRISVFAERPDLSYRPDSEAPLAPFAVATTVRARNGQADACEELLRKVAEAIPKVGDSARLITWQPVIGELGLYVALRPVADLTELDRQPAPAELLAAAFGPAEGGLIYRTGLQAIESAERDVMALRPDLSNPA